MFSILITAFHFLFPDAKPSEDFAEDVVGGDFAEDGAEGGGGGAEVFREEIGGEGGAEAVKEAAEVFCGP